jgi:hypothetical protein
MIPTYLLFLAFGAGVIWFSYKVAKVLMGGLID